VIEARKELKGLLNETQAAERLVKGGCLDLEAVATFLGEAATQMAVLRDEAGDDLSRELVKVSGALPWVVGVNADVKQLT
jgi:hypothetical protein